MSGPFHDTPATHWDQRYREGSDGWELGRPAPPLAAYLDNHPLAPRPPGTVLVPGCGRGHEVALLGELGFHAVGLDISGEALGEARRLHGEGGYGERGGQLRWVQVDLFDRQALAAAGLTSCCLQGVVEHTCFCAIEPRQRLAYIETMDHLLAPGGWLLGLFWCHGRPGGPPYGGDPERLADQWRKGGFQSELWEPARDSAFDRSGQPRQDEWLGLWRKPLGRSTADHSGVAQLASGCMA